MLISFNEQQHFAFHQFRCSEAMAEPSDCWPIIKPRGGGGNWSDNSSIPGRKSGNDYEEWVREKLTGSKRKQDTARTTATLDDESVRVLETLELVANKVSKESVGKNLWDKLFQHKGTETKAKKEAHAEADIVLNQDTDLVQSLGEGAELLYGKQTVRAGAIVEVSVHGALFYMKCLQLERYLTIYKAQKATLPPAAVLVINKKPIECSSAWLHAITKFSKLNKVGFSLVYCPHSLHIQAVQSKIQAYQSEIQAYQSEIQAYKKLAAALALCLTLIIVLVLAQRYAKSASSGEL